MNIKYRVSDFKLAGACVYHLALKGLSFQHSASIEVSVKNEV
jgi:hypothetical protein